MYTYLKENNLLLLVTVVLNLVLSYGFELSFYTLGILNVICLIVLPAIYVKEEVFPPEIKNIFDLIDTEDIEKLDKTLFVFTINEIEDMRYIQNTSCLTYSILRNKLKAVKYFLEKGFNINTKAANGEFALYTAIFTNNNPALDLLLKYKPNLDLESDHLRANAIETAVFRKNVYGFKALVNHGAQFSVKKYKKTCKL